MKHRQRRPRVVFTAFKRHHKALLWSAAADRLAEEIGLEVIHAPESRQCPEPAVWKNLFREADAIISAWECPKLDARVLGGCERLRFVGHAGGSVAGVVSPELFERGVVVSTANALMADAVARWGLMMAQVGLRGLLDFAQFGAKTPLRWENRRSCSDPGEAVVGIWGYGDIARRTINYLRCINVTRILVCDDWLSREEAISEGLERVGLEALFERAEVMLVLQSLTAATKGKITRHYLDRLGDSAVVINAARAGLFDESELVDSLREERYTFITDVHHHEPRPADSPMAALSNVIATPHCAGSEAEHRYAVLMLEEYGRFLEGEPLLHSVSAERALNMTKESLNAWAEK